MGQENEFEGLEEERKMNLKPVLIAGLVGCILSGAVVGGIAHYNANKKAKVAITSTQLGSWIESASDLVSEKYHYTDLVDHHEEGKKLAGITIPLTEEQTLIVYSGTINVGIDVSQITYDIDEGKKQITLTLPEPKIIAHEVDHDSVKSYEVKDSLFHKETYEEFAEVISVAKKEKEEQLAEDAEFLDGVMKDAEDSLNNLFTAVGVTESYTIVFK
ncbi:MAG: DUF4230 domain-containing protein [Oscillospiraceae bacterium]